MGGIWYIIASAVIILLAACENSSGDGGPADVECTTDDDCAPAGCSGQLCVSAQEASGIITTCEYKDEYECLKLTSCGCNEGKCGWADNDEYGACMQKFEKK